MSKISGQKIEWNEHPNMCGGWRATIDIDNVQLSIVAGQYYYSTPRKNLKNPDKYSDLELAIFINDEWASYNQLKELGVFQVLEETGEYDENHEPNKSQSNVFSYIPKFKILNLIEKLKSRLAVQSR